jgi:hypothetical protein
MTPDEDAYWSIDIPGLTESQADELLALARANDFGDGVAVGPREWLTMHLDRGSVQTLLDALLRHAEAGADVGGLAEEMQEWLGTASD